jgi:hypothetical protein
MVSYPLRYRQCALQANATRSRFAGAGVGTVLSEGGGDGSTVCPMPLPTIPSTRATLIPSLRPNRETAYAHASANDAPCCISRSRMAAASPLLASGGVTSAGEREPPSWHRHPPRNTGGSPLAPSSSRLTPRRRAGGWANTPRAALLGRDRDRNISGGRREKVHQHLAGQRPICRGNPQAYRGDGQGLCAL